MIYCKNEKIKVILLTNYIVIQNFLKKNSTFADVVPTICNVTTEENDCRLLV